VFFPPERKTRRILFLGRKHADHARTVMQMAQDRPALRRYGFRELGRVTHQQMAQELREALVFLSCGHPEGFGLPLAEAIACGCICVGYHGLGGRDFCLPALHAVEFGDLLGFLNSLEQAITTFEQDPHTSTQRLLEQALAIRSRYGTELEEQRAVQVWGALMTGESNTVA
jgi:glycosyltransferase involved in cell wall biosynthesis